MGDIRVLSRQERRAAKKYLQAENRKRSDVLVPLDRSDWPASTRFSSAPFLAIWRSSKFLVQVFDESDRYPGCVRVSVNRAAVDGKGDWVDGISWDELWEIKNLVGYEDMTAIEAYPKKTDLVNVANIRHLWIFTATCPIGFFWKGGS